MALEDDILREFLLESFENLSRLDLEMVELEREPENQELLGSVFRTIHTIKGTCGFLGFSRLQALAHSTEDILNELRQGTRRLDTPLASLLLKAVDAIKRILNAIQADGNEGEIFEDGLLQELHKKLEDGAGREPGPPEDVAPAPAPPKAAANVSDSALRVDVGLLDRLMNQVGELVLVRNQLNQFNAGREDAALNTISQRLNLITTELQEGVMKTRMQPISLLWNKLPRVIRDLAANLGKEIDLEMEGAHTELDRTILEAIKDPLTHIVRNSCDHGIESPDRRIAAGKPPRGTLSLRAFHEGGQVNIEIRDDGAGIDPERVKAKAVAQRLISATQADGLTEREVFNLIFLPGFSTAAEVTNVSGRGVGMDVVKTHVERIGGAVELLSQPGAGATVRIRIPLTLAIIPGLVVHAGAERFVIPQVNLHELIRVEGEHAVEQIHSAPVCRRRNKLLPLVDLSTTFGLQPQRAADETCIVVLQADENQFGLVVDRIGDSQEIVVKPLGQQLKGLTWYAGATIMGDGRISLILDVAGLGERAGVIAGSESWQGNAPADMLSPTTVGTKPLLLCRAGAFPRLAVPLAQVARLEKIAAADLERAGGRVAIQYRGRILPLVDLAEMLGGASSWQDTIHVVVVRGTYAEFGVMVEEISDIIDEPVNNPYPSDRPGLLGSAIVGGAVTDFLDMQCVEQWTGPSSPESIHRLQAALADEMSTESFAEAIL